MEAQLTTVMTGALLALFGAIVARQGKGRFDRLESDITGLRSEMIAMRSELAGMRSDLTHVALAVGTRPRPQTG